jgi:uncharacterized protein (DUF2235 family)
MPKRLVMCCDGTWNSADQVAPTNVSRFALAVASRDSNGEEQRAFYHAGVGTKQGERFRGGAFGFGLSRDVRDTYRFIVQNYEPGDEIFLVGFSRGAFTARSTAGLIRNSGVLRPENIDKIDQAYSLYRSRDARTHPRSVEAALFRRTYAHESRIRFIGVWDTVGALGVPLDGMRLVNIINRRWQFHDTDLSTWVDAAFQALAIDERRAPFKPTIWTQQADAGKQRLEQVWLTGVHSDVGGGYPDRALAQIALLWLVDKAQECGLSFDSEGFASPARDALGLLHDSRVRFYRLLPQTDRAIGLVDHGHEYASSTAVERYARIKTYRPQNLVQYLNGDHQTMNV